MNRNRRLKIRLLCVLVAVSTGILSAGSCSRSSTPKQVADAIYRDGDIITINDSQPTAEALAVKEGRIIAVGPMADVLSYKGDATRVVDLGGRTLLPGFIDAHGHVFNAGLQALAANLLARPDGSVNDIAALQKTLRDWADNYPKRQAATGWIT